MNTDGILLTGATGFIGSHVLEALTTAGMKVTALARPNADRSFVNTLGVDVRPGDIRDLPSLRAAAQGCATVIHTAGLACDWGSSEAFHQTNVRGTMNVLEACRLEGVSHIILTGSISSYGEEDSQVIKSESSPFNSHYPYLLDRLFPSGFNRYRDSKAQATRKTLDYAHEHHLNVTILEPAWVYGEREFGTGFFSYVKAVKDGQRFMPGSTRNCFHVIYARDLARAYLLACQMQLPGVERFIIGNPVSEPMHEIYEKFCREAGLQPPHRVPRWALQPIAMGLELVYTLARSSHPPLLTRGRLNMFYDSIHYSTDQARQKLGFECQFTLEQGIRQTVAWYKAHHYL